MATGDARITTYDLTPNKVAINEGDIPTSVNMLSADEQNRDIGFNRAIRENLGTSKADQNLRIADTPTHKNMKFADAATAAASLEVSKTFMYVDTPTNQLVFVSAAQLAVLLALKREDGTLHSLTANTQYVYTFRAAFSSVDDYNVVFRAYDVDADNYENSVYVKCKRETDKITFVADADCTLFLNVKTIN